MTDIIRPGAQKVSRNWRLTRDAFDRFAQHLDIAISNYEKTPPEETSFGIPTGLSPNTFCARFRDAKQALLLYGYDPLLQQRLLALGDVAIAMDPSGERIWFRARHQPGRDLKPTIDQVKRPFAPASDITDAPASREELIAICLLLSKGRISGPLFFRGQLHPAWIEDMESIHDVAFAWDEDTQTTTLI